MYVGNIVETSGIKIYYVVVELTFTNLSIKIPIKTLSKTFLYPSKKYLPSRPGFQYCDARVSANWTENFSYNCDY